jgi:hypothetical protein
MFHVPRSTAALLPLNAALFAALGLVPHQALATQVVSNCNASGAGSLAKALSDAADGELVDATGLACSTITLSGNFLIAPQNSVTIDGPGADNLTIIGADDYPLLLHTGDGTIEVDHVTLSSGDKYLNDDTINSGGGCISSSGSVKLQQTVVTGCNMTAGPKSFARGGAIYALGDVTLVQSTITGSATHGASPFGYEMNNFGGGIFAKGAIRLDNSTLSHNHSLIGGALYSSSAIQLESSTITRNDAQQGGGIACSCALQVTNSTISYNHAHIEGAINQSFGSPDVPASVIRNSTITGNVIDATFSAAAMEVGVAMAIYNSTIAFNIAPNSTSGEGAVYGFGGTLTLQSSIIAGNYPGDVDAQIGTTVIGSHNLSPASIAGMPDDTITECPQLQPLAFNGGPTQTLALRHTSPAINQGNNLGPLLTDDQRGAGFPRVFGAAADIGAFEWQGSMIDDSVFRGTFELRLGLCQP